MTAADAVARTAAAAAPVDLDTVVAAAGLQTRVDRKYLLTAAEFGRLAPVLAARTRALEIGGRRVFAYESVYFDTPDRLTYRQHLQGRRRRYKIRTRTYDGGACVLEVKCAAGGERTVKHRVPHPARDRARLTGAGRGFVAAALAAAYGLAVPDGLAPVLAITYDRATFADPAAGLRITCDTAIAVDPGPGRAPPLRAAPGLVIVEVKAVRPGSAAERELRRLRLRPVALSKYCAAVAALGAHGRGPALPGNPWRRVTRRLYGDGADK